MKRKRIAGVCITLAAVVLAGTFAVSGNNTKDKNHVEIINVSYDPTREFYEAYNKEPKNMFHLLKQFHHF